MSDREDPVAIAREVLLREADALRAVAARLDSAMTAAVELIESSEGRVIVTGVGKSGLVGAKLAATLTSTGTAAFFLHPTEALHGDLGVVTRRDVVFMLTKSGRSTELRQLLPHLARVGTPIIAVTSATSGPVVEAARVVIDLGPIEEACSLDLVPTTSTTAMIAVGDAVAVALLRRRGLTAEDFAFVHPGGLLGRQAARRVRELMHAGPALPVVPSGATMRDALVEIMEKGIGVTAVAAVGGGLAGILTDGDLKRILLASAGVDVLAEPVDRFMTRSPRVIDPDAMVAAAVRLMETPRPGKVTSLVVVEEGRPVGILHLHDCLEPGTPPE